jgi:hypothetical protein
MMIMTMKQVLDHGGEMQSNPKGKGICIVVSLLTTKGAIECMVGFRIDSRTI